MCLKSILLAPMGFRILIIFAPFKAQTGFKFECTIGLEVGLDRKM